MRQQRSQVFVCGPTGRGRFRDTKGSQIQSRRGVCQRAASKPPFWALHLSVSEKRARPGRLSRRRAFPQPCILRHSPRARSAFPPPFLASSPTRLHWLHLGCRAPLPVPKTAKPEARVKRPGALWWTRLQPSAYAHLVEERAWTHDQFTEWSVESLMSELTEP